MWYRPGEAYLYGFELFDREGNKLFESAWKNCFTEQRYKCLETVLSEGERIIGFKSRKVNNTTAFH
jgi:hypothetical protein